VKRGWLIDGTLVETTGLGVAGTTGVEWGEVCRKEIKGDKVWTGGGWVYRDKRWEMLRVAEGGRNVCEEDKAIGVKGVGVRWVGSWGEEERCEG